MQRLCDRRYGNTGKWIWLFVVRLFALIWLVVALTQALVTIDFSGQVAVLGIGIIANIALLYWLIGNIQVLLEAPYVAQSVEVNEEISVRFYFGREITFSAENIEDVSPYRVNQWVKISSLLDFRKDNYLVTLKDDTQFFVASRIADVTEFMTNLQTHRWRGGRT